MTLLAAGSSACFGQTPLAVPANPDSALQTIVGSLDGTPLSLHDAVQSALHNSTSVLTAEAALMAAGGARRIVQAESKTATCVQQSLQSLTNCRWIGCT